ncbi:MAG: hypothetical protein HY052_09070 [Proteobacteria bacterium]|nr:hypothetical protein [Pseudomonadota bacterium]
MLSNQLQIDLSTLTSVLKQNMSESLVDSSETFLNECQAVVSRYDQSTKPNDSEVYQAVLLYLKGEIGEDIEYLFDLVAFGLYLPIESLGNKCVAYDQRKLEVLLNRYRAEAGLGQLWEMTWLGVLQAYYQPEIRFSEQNILLQFLKDTYPYVVTHMGHDTAWLKALKNHPDMLTREPCHSFVERWLAGREQPLKQVANDLQIPDQSWFWQELVRSCIKFAADKPDEDFKKLIPQLLALIRERPGFLDEDLSTILYRYHQCTDKNVNEELKDFAVWHWKNPKLRYAPGSKWIQIQTPVWQMVLGWVNDAHLRLFFERISARYGAGKDRLSSWLRYIAWTKFVSNYEANRQQQKDPEIARIFEAEEAALVSPEEVRDHRLDVFIKIIGDYLATA